MPLTNDNHTQVSNEFIDEHMRGLNDAAIRVFLVVTRKTKGWHKETDSISLSQMVEMTGLSSNGVRRGVADLLEHGLIRVDREGIGRGHIPTYTLNYSGNKGAATEPIIDEKGSVIEPIIQIKGAATEPTKERRDKETRKKKAGSSSALDTKTVTDLFWELYKKRTGSKPVWKVQYRDFALKLLRAAPLEKIHAAMRLYFEDRKLWYTQRNGLDFGQFFQHFNELLSVLPRSPDPVEKARIERMELAVGIRKAGGNGGQKSVGAPCILQDHAVHG